MRSVFEFFHTFLLHNQWEVTIGPVQVEIEFKTIGPRISDRLGSK